MGYTQGGEGALELGTRIPIIGHGIMAKEAEAIGVHHQRQGVLEKEAAEMLEMSMDMEADLGIDSIKRVEILGAMRERFTELPPFKAEELAELRTLQQIVDYMRAQLDGDVSPAQPAPASWPA